METVHGPSGGGLTILSGPLLNGGHMNALPVDNLLLGGHSLIDERSEKFPTLSRGRNHDGYGYLLVKHWSP